MSGIVPYADINTRESNSAFLTKAIEIIKGLKNNDYDVIVSLAGGRKTMSTLISYAAEVCKVDRLYHLIVSKWIEEHGNPETWPASGKQKLETRNRVLHPSETDKNVVRMLSGKDVEELASKSGPVLEQMIKSKLDVVGGLENP